MPTEAGPLSVKYYGYVFDASGYGHAARAYIHALHAVGIDLSVVDLTQRSPQVDDPLVRSFIKKPVEPDFHIFHGIPPEWARLAFPLRNAVGLTVWETNVMPSQWRNVLNHVVDVWLPCEFNTVVFSRGLESSVFRLPHPFFPSQPNGGALDPNTLLATAERDWVVYSICEWQDRKCPDRIMEAYLQAFHDVDDTVLLLKTNPHAARLAQHTLDALRSRIPSRARVTIRAEAWSDHQIAALHARGDCYISLHRGEGWSYPLFEAAGRGTPVIATGYSGPLDYLDPVAHQLVRYRLVPVRQPYRYYSPRMEWADPELDDAVARLRWVYAHREIARQRSQTAATAIREAYDLKNVGAAAKDRLLHLLQRSNPERSRSLNKMERARRLHPSIPVPGSWYDEDYFERGIKSNWSDGYGWASFSGLFRSTAAFLARTFPEARSILDIGCAKGFLVRALRESGRKCWGFDFSPWAIGHAEREAAPFLVQASVDDFTFERAYDLLVAFEVFEHLTDRQVVSFLARARTQTHLALLATIPSFDSDAECARFVQDDGDLSHITIRSRGWWHERFMEAGWRQDGLHRVVQRICQDHELPARMGWKMFVYAP